MSSCLLMARLWRGWKHGKEAKCVKNLARKVERKPSTMRKTLISCFRGKYASQSHSDSAWAVHREHRSYEKSEVTLGLVWILQNGLNCGNFYASIRFEVLLCDTESVSNNFFLHRFQEWSGELFCRKDETHTAVEHVSQSFSKLRKTLLTDSVMISGGNEPASLHSDSACAVHHSYEKILSLKSDSAKWGCFLANVYFRVYLSPSTTLDGPTYAHDFSAFPFVSIQ